MHFGSFDRSNRPSSAEQSPVSPLGVTVCSFYKQSPVSCLIHPLCSKKKPRRNQRSTTFPTPRRSQLLLRYLTMVSRNIRKEKINFLHTNVSQSKKEKKADLYCVGCYGNFHNNHNNKINNCNIKRRMYYIVFICYSPLKENEHFFSLNPRSETVMKC